MANFKVKDKKIIPEFVGSLMKAIARGGAKKTIRQLEKDPTIKQSIANIKKIDKDLKDYIEKKRKSNPEFKKDYDKTLDLIKNY
tara:strand:+ start:938 stop:1189 length:252 start_codon:yes stop_codon:yes gene_type:complete